MDSSPGAHLAEVAQGEPVHELVDPVPDRGLAPPVFERFTRLDEARARDRSGAGLGLAIVDRHGGTVRATDGPAGRGAAVVVDLPAVAP